MSSMGPSSLEIYKSHGCMECKHASFYYDPSESMRNEDQVDCKNKNNNWEWDRDNWALLKSCPFKEEGTPDWSNYNEPKYDPELGRWI